MLKEVGRWLTEPSKYVVDEDDRRRARLLSALTIPFLFVAPVGVAFTNFETERQVVTFILVAAIFTYIFSRTRYFNAAGVIFVTTLFIPPHFNMHGIGEIDQLSLLALLAWVNLPTVLGSLWLKLGVVFKLWLCNFAVLLSAPILINDKIAYEDYATGLVHVTIIGSIVLLGARIRNSDHHQLVEQAEELKKANKAKSVFLANMSHELRTPLHGILGFAQLGEQSDSGKSPERIEKYFSQIHTSGNRLLSLLNDLLDLSKLEAGKMEMNFAEEDIASYIAVLVELEEASLRAKKLTIEFDIDSSLSMVECDSQRIGQVFINLLNNAIKFSHSGGRLFVAIGKGEGLSIQNVVYDSVVISLGDEGRGIPNDELEFIFEKFSQSSENTFSTGSTGLGLAISREIVQQHQGRIWCENRSESGAQFNFEIPVTQPKDVH